MTKKGMDVPPFATEERSPLKDLTNTTMDGSANLTHNQTNDPKRKSVQSWYARMSDEKKAEYNAKRRISRQQKKVAALDCASQDQFKQKFVPPLGIVQCTPFSDITNRQTKGTCATSTASISANTPQTHASGTCATSTASIPANTPHTHALGTCATSTASIPANTPQTHASETCATSTAPICQQQIGASANKQGGKGWYANLSDEKKAEHLRKLRMAREQKRTAALVLNVDVPQSSTQQDKHGSAQSGITRILGTPTGDTNMEEDGSVDWLHTNPTYKRKVRSKEHVAGMDGQDSFLAQSFILGSSIEPIDASYEKERLRKRTKYFDMAAAQKDVVLSRNRAYKKRKRDTITLSDQHDITDGMCGSTDQSSSAPAIIVQPLYKNYHRGGCSNEEDSDAHGIFEPMGQTSETEECLGTIQEEETLNDDDDDDECRLYSAQGNEFESYRVTADGSHSFETHDPYDYVYKNLPTKHHVLKPVKDCVHCGAMRFQYEGPAFCCRKAIGVLSLVGST